MHFKCTRCPNEFCSGCGESLKKGKVLLKWMNEVFSVTVLPSVRKAFGPYKASVQSLF